MRTLTSCRTRFTMCVVGCFLIGCGSGDDAAVQNEPAPDPATMGVSNFMDVDPVLASNDTTATDIADDPSLSVNDPSLTEDDPTAVAEETTTPQGLSPEEQATQDEILALAKKLIAKRRPRPANVPPSLAMINIGGPGKVISDSIEAVDGRIVAIDLKFTPTSDSDLETLSKLTSLELLGLWGTDITDAGLKHLAKLQNLDSVLVGYTGVTAEGAAELKAKLPDCRVQPFHR